MPIKASQVIDWTDRSYPFWTTDDGYRCYIVGWGDAPEVGEAVALRSKTGRACYRVIDRNVNFAPGDDSFTLVTAFVPGQDVEYDQ